MKDRLLLLIAVVAGLVATVLAFVYIDASATDPAEAAPTRTIDVLFAVEDLPANAVIDADRDLRVETISVDETPGLARSVVKAADKNAVDGRPISSPLPAGMPLLFSHLTEIRDVDLDPRKRAMAISVSRENLMGGLLVPGDRVDIVVSYQLPEERSEADMGSAGAGTADPASMVNSMMSGIMGQMGSLGGSSVPSRWTSETVLANVRVIAVGTSLSGSRQAQMFGLAGGSGGGSTITLELTTEEALLLIKMQANGANPLTLLLRPDASRADAVTGSALSGD